MSHWRWGLLLVAVIAGVALGLHSRRTAPALPDAAAPSPLLATPPAGAALAERVTGYAGASANPQSPGFHKLLYHCTIGGAPCDIPFVLYLPEGYGQRQDNWPLIVFLHGLGERGTDPQIVFTWGIPQHLLTNPELRKWVPCMILMPQCPPEARWETPGIGKAVVELMREVANRWPVDRSSVYLTGISMGGTGCWAVAREGGGDFAVVATIVGHDFEPEQVAQALRGTGTTCLIISGGEDERSEPGSGLMAEALQQASVDVVYAKVPGAGHNIFARFYTDQTLYQWLLSHHRGQDPPKDRLLADAFIAMGASPRSHKNQQRYQQLNSELQRVARWWQLDSCSLDQSCGLRPRGLDRQNVYVTRPFAAGIPCRLQTTTTLPAAAHVALHLVVGHAPEASWKLTLRVNERETFTTTIDQAHSHEGWVALDIDLTPFAGQEVRLQLVDASDDQPPSEAYWQTVKVVSD